MHLKVNHGFMVPLKRYTIDKKKFDFSFLKSPFLFSFSFVYKRTYIHPITITLACINFIYYRMYDVDGNGVIDLEEMTKIVQAIYDMLGAGAVKPTDTAEERAKNIFNR